MSLMRIEVLGTLAIEHEGMRVADLTAQKAQALLAYLAVLARPQSRQALAGLLWTDVMESSARASLRMALAQVRKAVGDHVQADRHTVWLDLDRAHWIDAHIFENACRQLQRQVPVDPSARQSLREAVYLYRDTFLTGFLETDASLFEEWVLQQRERYRHLALDALQRLAEDGLRRNAQDSGIEDARRILELDPVHEEAHRLLMQFYARAGNTVAALRQYDACLRILEADLGLLPDEKTTALAQSLRSERQMSEAPTLEMPVAASSDTSVPTNLPTTMTRLVGRDTELSTLDELLSSDHVRLISIVGPGGMGKTSLSIAAAQRHVEDSRFAQGVYFADLAPLRSPERILTALAEVLSLPLQASVGDRRTPLQQVLDYVRAKNILLVLDNYEHLLEGADLVGAILQAAPGVKVLVTSRERLGLPGEQVFPIQGLDYASRDRPDASAPAAAQLFVEAVQRSAPDFAVNEAQSAHVEEICRLVEGMPLAIELAASWAEALSLDEIARELRGGIEILATSALHGRADRHRSLRAVFDSTWLGLDESLRAVFARLSVFQGGFTRTAAEQVTGASLVQLRTLIGKSMIQYDRERNRYTLHELLRLYGAERLAQSQATGQDARSRHSVYFCGMAHNRGKQLLGARQMEAVAELEREAENVRVAWKWAVGRHQWDLVEQTADGLGFFYEWKGRLEEGEATFQIASDALSAYDGPDTQELLSLVYVWRSAFVHPLGRTGEAEDLLSEAVRLLERGQASTVKLAFAWLRRGIQAFNYDDDKAREGFTRSLESYRKIDHKWGIARALSGLGQAYADDGRHVEAAAHYRQAIELLQEIGDRRGEAYALHRLAITVRNVGSLEEAMVQARRSQQLYEEMNDRAGLAWSSQILAECLFRTGAFDEAIVQLSVAEMLALELGDSSRLANIYHIQAVVLSAAGQYHEARSRAEKGLALARRISQSARIAWCQFCLAVLDTIEGDSQAAEQRLAESEVLLASQGRRHEISYVYGLQAVTALMRQDRIRAGQRCLASLRLSREHHYKVEEGLGALVLVLADAERREDALAVLGFLTSIPMNKPLTVLVRQRLASLVDPMPPQAVDKAMSRYRDADIWGVVEMWIAELERMVGPRAGDGTGNTGV